MLTYHGQVKKICSAVSFHYSILGMLCLRRGHSHIDTLYNIHGLLSTVSGIYSLGRVSFLAILICSVLVYCHLSIASTTNWTGFERSIPILVSRFLLSTSSTSVKVIIPTITTAASVDTVWKTEITPWANIQERSFDWSCWPKKGQHRADDNEK